MAPFQVKALGVGAGALLHPVHLPFGNDVGPVLAAGRHQKQVHRNFGGQGHESFEVMRRQAGYAEYEQARKVRNPA